jgi:F-type H+-transporting ATPase subunit delta
MMADDSSIARPYADAVFELARAANQLSQWSGLLHAAARVVSDDDIRQLIDAPTTDLGAVVDLVTGISRDASAASLIWLPALVATLRPQILLTLCSSPTC